MTAWPRSRRVGTVISNDAAEIPLDATLSESYEASYEVAEDALEDGSTTSDHINRKARKFSLTGVISRVSLGTFLPDDPRRLEIARDTLLAIADARGTVTIVNGYNVLEDYAIESIKLDRSAGEGHQVQVSMSLSELVTTASQTTQILAENINSEFAPTLGTLALGGEQVPEESEGVEVKGEISDLHEQYAYSVLTGGRTS